MARARFWATLYTVASFYLQWQRLASEGRWAEENIVGSRQAKEAIRGASSPEDQQFNLLVSLLKRTLYALNWDTTCSGKAEHNLI